MCCLMVGRENCTPGQLSNGREEKNDSEGEREVLVHVQQDILTDHISVSLTYLKKKTLSVH